MLMKTIPSKSRTLLKRRHHAEGFTLVMVIWVFGLVLLLGTAITVGVRYRTRTDTSLLDSQRAEVAAESAINLALLLHFSKKGDEKTPFPLTCRMPGGEQVTISVAEEAGKVDLNASSAQTLVKLFVGLSSGSRGRRADRDGHFVEPSRSHHGWPTRFTSGQGPRFSKRYGT